MDAAVQFLNELKTLLFRDMKIANCHELWIPINPINYDLIQSENDTANHKFTKKLICSVKLKYPSVLYQPREEM